MFRRCGICLGLALSLGCDKISASPVLEEKLLQEKLLVLPPLAARAIVPESKPLVPPTEEDFIAFWSPVGPNAQLFLYDDLKKEVFAFPGAGKGINNATTYLPGQYIFERRGQIYLYDTLEEKVCLLGPTLPIVAFALSPAPDLIGNVYFLGTNDPQKALLGIGKLYVASTLKPRLPLPNPFRHGEIAELSKVNAEDITSFKVTLDGAKLVFTTVEGDLFLYTPLAPSLRMLSIGKMKADFASIDPIWGRFVVWKELAGKNLFLLDLSTDCIEPLSFASEALDLIDIGNLSFLGADPWHVFYVGVLAPPLHFRVFSYDLRDGRIRDYSLIGDIPAESPAIESTASAENP